MSERRSSEAQKRIAIGRNRDGRLEVFYVSPDGSLRHNWQASPNGLWKGESKLATGGAREVACGVNADGRLEVFYLDASGTLQHDWQLAPGGKWNGAEALVSPDGSPAKALAVAVASNADGRLEVFYVGADRDLHHDWQLTPNGDWNGRERLGGPCLESGSGAVTVGRNQDGRLEVFYLGAKGEVLHDWQTEANGDWHGPEALTGKGREIIVGANADGRLEAFWRDDLDIVWHDWQTEPNGDWHGQESLGVKARRIDVAQNRDGRLEVFFVDPKGNIRNQWQVAPNGDWGTDDEILGDEATDLAIGQNQDGRLELFYFGRGSEIWHNWQPRPNAGPWNPIVHYDAPTMG